LLVGLTVESAGAKAPQKHQLYGTVLSADHRTGIALSLLGNRSGESYILPPDTRAIHLACEQLGKYLLTKHLAPNGHIHIAVDRVSKYELVAATLESLEGTGFKVGFVNYDAQASP
jgi:hypothetical protein